MREMRRPVELSGMGVVLNVVLAALSVAVALWGACHAAEAVTGDVVTGASAGVETFFQTELGQVVLASIGAVASAAFAAFTASGWYKTHTNWVTRKIAEIVANAVATTYTQHVRAMKRMSPDGQLSLEQKKAVEDVAIDVARNAARREGLISQPVFQDTDQLRGAVVQAVAAAKHRAWVKRPSTKGGV